MGQGGAGGAGAGGTAGAGGATPAERCDPLGVFGLPIPLATLNTTEDEAAARLTPDELTVYFERTDGLYAASRSNTTEPFIEIGPLGSISNSSSEGEPWISADGLTLFFEGYDGGYDVFLATRASPDVTFTSIGALGVGAGNDATDPYVVGGPNGRLYFTSDYSALARVQLSNWIPQGMSTLDTIGDSNPLRPVLTEDELTVYFGSDISVTYSDIWRAQRQTRDALFETPSPVPELNSDGLDYPSWISRDGCRLYFEQGPNGERDLYFAERSP